MHTSTGTAQHPALHMSVDAPDLEGESPSFTHAHANHVRVLSSDFRAINYVWSKMNFPADPPPACHMAGNGTGRCGTWVHPPPPNTNFLLCTSGSCCQLKVAVSQVWNPQTFQNGEQLNSFAGPQIPSEDPQTPTCRTPDTPLVGPQIPQSEAPWTPLQTPPPPGGPHADPDPGSTPAGRAN